MKHTSLSFADVLIKPQFSTIKSRKDVDVSQDFLGVTFGVPIISSNMDSVTENQMAHAMWKLGAGAAIHRFCSIEENVAMFHQSCTTKTMVSVGLGSTEIERAEALFAVGANTFILDLAHGASLEAVKQVQSLRSAIGPNAKIVVGNFATKQSISDFKFHLGDDKVDAWKIGIGGGSACTTRIVTGCGMPTLASILDCAGVPEPIIADGGITNSGDVAKALAAGASMVMIGKLLAGTTESPGLVNWNLQGKHAIKIYRGSASKESYEVQGKTADWRSAEGESFEIPFVGPAKGVINQLEGGLRSAMSYVNATNLNEFREFAELIKITGQGVKESQPHGKNS